MAAGNAGVAALQGIAAIPYRWLAGRTVSVFLVASLPPLHVMHSYGGRIFILLQVLPVNILCILLLSGQHVATVAKKRFSLFLAALPVFLAV